MCKQLEKLLVLLWNCRNVVLFLKAINNKISEVGIVFLILRKRDPFLKFPRYLLKLKKSLTGGKENVSMVSIDYLLRIS